MDGNHNTDNTWTPKRKNGFAIAAFIAAFLAFVTSPVMVFGISLFFSLIAIILALIARFQIRKAPQLYVEEWYTKAAFTIAWIMIALHLIFLFIVATFRA